jgi:predicted MFS family arabinose efflux permease
MNLHTSGRDDAGGYLVGRGHAWFAFTMTFALMLFDYMDRQVIVSLFPHMKTDWGLSDKQLGALVSVVSITVALAGIPVALLADRGSRVRSIVAMAAVWSLASVSCMFTRTYGLLLAARAVVGLGEAGYGSVGAALIASLFPARLRAGLMATFFAAASIGSVLGVLLGGVIAARYGWQTAFGVVGFPGLVLALVYLKVRDYKTVALTAPLSRAASSTGNAVRFIAGALVRSRTMAWVCVGDAAQLIVVSALWAWMPSYLSRVQGMPTQQASIKAALVVLCGAFGSMVWGFVVDRAGAYRARNKLHAVAIVCAASLCVLTPAFVVPLAPDVQFLLVAVGGFLATCTAGAISAVVIDVIHPGVRATGASVLSLFRNLFGLAAGPFIAGMLSDAYGLGFAMTITPLFSIVAVACFTIAARSYEGDMRGADLPVDAGAAAGAAGAAQAPA